LPRVSCGSRRNAVARVASPEGVGESRGIKILRSSARRRGRGILEFCAIFRDVSIAACFSIRPMLVCLQEET